MAVALTPAITVMPTASPSSSADLRVTSAVRVEPKSIVVRTNGPKGTIFMIVPAQLVAYTGFWQIPVPDCDGHFFRADVQHNPLTGWNCCNHFKYRISTINGCMPPIICSLRYRSGSFQYRQIVRCLCLPDGRKCRWCDPPGQSCRP